MSKDKIICAKCDRYVLASADDSRSPCILRRTVMIPGVRPRILLVNDHTFCLAFVKGFNQTKISIRVDQIVPSTVRRIFCPFPSARAGKLLVASVEVKDLSCGGQNIRPTLFRVRSFFCSRFFKSCATWAVSASERLAWS